MYRQRNEKNSRIRILLNETEYSELASTIIASRASKSLLVVEAIQEGLRNLYRIESGTRRTRRIEVRIPQEYRTAIKRLAITRGLSQQAILRLMLRNYLNTAQWNATTKEERSESNCIGI